MELIKENKEKCRAVFKLNETTIRKYWYNRSIDWLDVHVYSLDIVFPGYVIDHGSDQSGVFADFKKIDGIPASEFPHTDDFIKMICSFCLKNIKETYPYAHGDWVLSNIIINDTEIKMCDWDNLSIQSEETVLKKMTSDLRSAFGDKISKVLP